MQNLPWQYSDSLKASFIYLPESDELVFDDGQQRVVPRPSSLPKEALASATYHGVYPPVQRTATSDTAATSESVDTTRTTASFASPVLSARTTTASDGWHVVEGSHRSQYLFGVGAGLYDAGYSRPAGDSREHLVGVGGELNDAVYAKPSGDPREHLVGVGAWSLDSQYRPRRKPFFSPGRVFSTLWSESAGTGSTIGRSAADIDMALIETQFGETIHSKIRRFVVIRQGETYCNALPISTYGRQGTEKPRLARSEHAVIYTTPITNELLDEMAKHGTSPGQPDTIRVNPDTSEDKLDPTSLVNLGQVQTIQYNVKVKPCGIVSPESMPALLSLFSEVFRMPGSSSAVSAVPYDAT